MVDGRKAGAAIMIIAVLLVIAAIILSNGWIDQATIIFNVLSVIRIQYLSNYDAETCTIYHQCSYDIDFPAKYLILFFLVVAAYGLSVYLGIFPAPWHKRTMHAAKSAD